MTSRVAAIDCGTNSIRLLISEDADAGLRELERRLELVRLGQGVDASGEFHPEALARTFAACDDYARIIDSYECVAVRFIATSAARDARNRDDFLAGVRARFGVEAEVISGAEEAQLSFSGALSGVKAQGIVLVIDIGGGSTELVLGESNGRIHHACSLDIGSVRITERYFEHRPPTTREIEQARAMISSLWEKSGIEFARVNTAIGVAGTVTSMSAAIQQLPVYDRAKVHGSVLTEAEIAATSRDWLSATLAQMVSRPGMHPLRAEVLPAGSLILDELVRRLRTGGVVVSETDILDGIVGQMIGRLGR